MRWTLHADRRGAGSTEYVVFLTLAACVVITILEFMNASERAERDRLEASPAAVSAPR